MTYIRLYMPKGGEEGVILATLDDKYVVEFRGHPYSTWDEKEDSPMYAVHSAIKQANISDLHCGRVETITPWHSEWDAIYKLVFEALQGMN